MQNFEGKLYIQIGKKKDVSKQPHANPKAELCAFKGGEWIRVAGGLVEDNRVEARQSMLDAYPELKKMYAADDGNTEVFYFKNGVATFTSIIRRITRWHSKPQRLAEQQRKKKGNWKHGCKDWMVWIGW